METCDHEETEQYGFIREDGYIVEYTEACTECEKEWIWSYGSLEEK